MIRLKIYHKSVNKKLIDYLSLDSQKKLVAIFARIIEKSDNSKSNNRGSGVRETRRLEEKVGSFEMQPAINDVTGPALSINLSIFKFFLIDKFSPTSNFLHNFFDMQIFFNFRLSIHNILSNNLKFYPKCLKHSTIIFPKFLENFHEVFVPNFSKFLTTFPKFVLIFL